MATSRKIFISYRREDAADAAGRIRDWLLQTKRVAQEDIFMDVTAILPGADFAQVIDNTIGQCKAMIVVISPSWLAQVNLPGTVHVRLEVEAALRRRILIIPVLVGGASMPTADQLPPSLRELHRFNAWPVRPDSFDFDMQWVRRGLGISRGVRASWVVAVSAVVLVALTTGTLSQTPKGNPVWLVLHPTASSATPTVTTIPTTTATSIARTTPTTMPTTIPTAPPARLLGKWRNTSPSLSSTDPCEILFISALNGTQVSASFYLYTDSACTQVDSTCTQPDGSCSDISGTFDGQTLKLSASEPQVPCGPSPTCPPCGISYQLADDGSHLVGNFFSDCHYYVPHRNVEYDYLSVP